MGPQNSARHRQVVDDQIIVNLWTNLRTVCLQFFGITAVYYLLLVMPSCIIGWQGYDGSRCMLDRTLTFISDRLCNKT